MSLDPVRPPRPRPHSDSAAWWRWLWVCGLVALAALANAGLWWAAQAAGSAPEVAPRFPGLAYNGHSRWGNPMQGDGLDPLQVESDLRLMSRFTNRIRTYSVQGADSVLDHAQHLGLKVSQGVWLDGREAANQKELQTALRLARHPAVEALVVGNETVLQGWLSPEALVTVMNRLRAAGVTVPLTTAEPWHVWLKHPELAEAVDVISVHLLPYWEGVPVEAALDEAHRRWQEVVQRYPHKAVWIGEMGWPSAGAVVEVDRRALGGGVDRAVPSPDHQARFMRHWLADARFSTAQAFVMEAFDQPWKAQAEGRAGAHWGLWDARRQWKFSFVGRLEHDPYWRGKAEAAVGLGLLTLLPVAGALGRWRRSSVLALALGLQAVATGVVWMLTWPLSSYLQSLDMLALALWVPALALMAAIVLSQAFECVELCWDSHLRHQQLLPPAPPPAGAGLPWVSVHLPCCNEPPDMVLHTLEGLLNLDWPRLEVVVVMNNTPDERLWRPVMERVQAVQAEDRSGLSLKWIHLPRWPGFKAGALNEALRHTHADAAWVAVVDADYRVQAQWLREAWAWCGAPGVAVVQAPQAHRHWEGQRLARWMNWEYEGFFRLGMHHRQERNAIIQHGTMTLIRRSSLDAVGGWNEDCICEDTELGLRLLERGWTAVYVDRVWGQGLVPERFADYAKQRQRWAHGAMQIARTHARWLWGPSGLTWSQRYHFVAGWCPWWGDALHSLFTFTAVAYSLASFLWPPAVALPSPWALAPLWAYVLWRVLVTPLMYRRRVPCSWADAWGAAWVGWGLSHAVARGVWAGLWQGRGVFRVTAKQGSQPWGAGLPAHSGVRQERALALLLWACALAVGLQQPQGPALWSWWALLAVQSLPYLAAWSSAAVGDAGQGAQPAASA